MPAYGALNSSLTAASQPVDVITNDYVTGDGSDQLQLTPDTKEVGSWTVEGNLCKEFEPDAVTKGGQEGEEMVSDSWSPTPACVIGETCTPTCPTGLTGETLVQPFKGTSAAFDPNFTPDRGGDSLTGEDRPMDVWTNGSATSFEDRVVIDFDANDAQFGMRENLGSTAGPGGSTFRTGYTNGTICEGFSETDLGVGPGNDIVNMQSGPGLKSDNRFVFEPMDVMSSLGGSIDPGLDADGGFQPREVSAVQIGQPPEPKLWLQMLG